MSGVAEKEHEARERRVRHPLLLAGGIGCYVLAAITGIFLLTDDYGPGLLVPAWTVHAVLLALLVRKLGAVESSAYAALFIVLTSLMCVMVADLAREDLTLQQRGEKVTATVVKVWRDPAQGRKARDYHYALERREGGEVQGPPLTTPSGLYAVGQEITVIEDPEGELKPRTPGQAPPVTRSVPGRSRSPPSPPSGGWRGVARTPRGAGTHGRGPEPPQGRTGPSPATAPPRGSRRRSCARPCAPSPPTGAATSR